jgi:hypothetical protein
MPRRMSSITKATWSCYQMMLAAQANPDLYAERMEIISDLLMESLKRLVDFARVSCGSEIALSIENDTGRALFDR